MYRLNGDYNPLHADPTIGPKMGFKGRIVEKFFSLQARFYTACAHIISLLCRCSELLEIQILPTSKALKHDSPLPCFPEVGWVENGLIADELETLMWVTGKATHGASEIIFETRANGKPVLTNGRAFIASFGEKSKL